MTSRFTRLLAAGAAACAATASAQLPSVVRLAYDSAFEGYRSYREPEPRAWRDANDEARMLGGHVGQLKPSPPASAPREPTGSIPPQPHPDGSAPAKVAPHAGHAGHGK